MWVTLKCCFGSSTVNGKKPILEADMSVDETFSIFTDADKEALKA